MFFDLKIVTAHSLRRSTRINYLVALNATQTHFMLTDIGQ